MKKKEELSFWQIWNMAFGFLGIQFGWGLQMGNMSAIYEFLGASPDQIPLLWLAARFVLDLHTGKMCGRRAPVAGRHIRILFILLIRPF